MRSLLEKELFQFPRVCNLAKNFFQGVHIGLWILNFPPSILFLGRNPLLVVLLETRMQGCFVFLGSLGKAALFFLLRYLAWFLEPLLGRITRCIRRGGPEHLFLCLFSR